MPEIMGSTGTPTPTPTPTPPTTSCSVEMEEKELNQSLFATDMSVDSDSNQNMELDRSREVTRVQKSGQTSLHDYVDGGGRSVCVTLPDGAIWFNKYMERYGKLKANTMYHCQCPSHPEGLIGNHVGKHLRKCKSKEQAYVTIINHD